MLPQASLGVVTANLQLSPYISETVQATTKVTIECEYVIYRIDVSFNLE